MKFSLALLAASYAIQTTTAHFTLNYPTSIGFNDDTEGSSPCGGSTIDFSKNTVSDFHVGGNAVAMSSYHPQGNWLFRATLDQTAMGNWTVLFPIVQQSGLGNFCEPALTVPSSFVGKKGIIQVIQDAVDGNLYQCATVNFVNGSQAAPSICVNQTGVTGSFVGDSNLPSTASGSASASASRSASATGSNSASASATKNAAAGALGVQSSFGGPFASIAWLVGVFAATVAFAMM